MCIYGILRWTFAIIGDIQIISDTLGGSSPKCHVNFSASLYSDFNASGFKKSCLRESLGFERHFLSNGFHTSILRNHKNSYWNKIKCHKRGSQKRQKM